MIVHYDSLPGAAPLNCSMISADMASVAAVRYPEHRPYAYTPTTSGTGDRDSVAYGICGGYGEERIAG